MPQRTVTVGSRVGLHARPASIFSKAAAAAPVPVLIGTEGSEPVDAGSMLLVMTLGVGHGEKVTLTAEGEGAEAALDDLCALLARDLDAEH
jgi:phosphocarrier protein HPr